LIILLVVPDSYFVDGRDHIPNHDNIDDDFNDKKINWHVNGQLIFLCKI